MWILLHFMWGTWAYADFACYPYSSCSHTQTPLGLLLVRTEHCVCFPCGRVICCSEYHLLPLLYFSTPPRQELDGLVIWSAFKASSESTQMWAAGGHNSLTLEKEIPAHTYPLSLHLVHLFAEKDKKWVFTTQHNSTKACAGCATYTILLTLTKPSQSRDYLTHEATEFQEIKVLAPDLSYRDGEMGFTPVGLRPESLPLITLVSLWGSLGANTFWPYLAYQIFHRSL